MRSGIQQTALAQSLPSRGSPSCRIRAKRGRPPHMRGDTQHRRDEPPIGGFDAPAALIDCKRRYRQNSDPTSDPKLSRGLSPVRTTEMIAVAAGANPTTTAPCADGTRSSARATKKGIRQLVQSGPQDARKLAAARP